MPQEKRDLTVAQAFDLGSQMAEHGDHRTAVGLFRGVLAHEPNNFEAIERLGASLFNEKQIHEALYWFWRGRKLQRRSPMALTNYGLTLSQLGHPQEAIIELQRAAYLAQKEKMAPAVLAICHNNLGNAYERLGQYEDALECLDKGIALNPQDAFPRYNRGIVLLRLNRHVEALASLDQAIAMNPADHDALYNRGMGRLLLGDFKGGFADYEARMLTSENKTINLGLPAEKKWDGGDLAGRKILVSCEQGIGDTIQFLRFLPQLMQRNPAKVMLVAHSAIASMIEADTLAAMQPGAQVEFIPSGADIDHASFDRWVAIMSLPALFGVDQESDIPPPWMPQIEDERFRRWHTKLALPESAVNIGVCWAGNWMHKNDRHRSIALATFSKIFATPGCKFVSLQQVRPAEKDEFDKLCAKHSITATDLKDMRDTAAIIANLDMVISVDTSVAHLAATLGTPTKILIPAFGPDWRWQLNREDSPWYSDAQLYRQPKIGDWESVINRLCKELTELTSSLRDAA